MLEITSGRTLEAIKGVHKSTRYQELLASLQQRKADSGELQLERTTSDPGDGAPDDIPKDLTPAPPEQSVEWVGKVRDAIYTTSVCQVALAFMPSTLVFQQMRPGPCSTRNMPGGYHPWLDPVRGHLDGGYGLDYQCAQRGQDLSLLIHACSDFSKHQGSAVPETSFPVPGRWNLPQYLWLCRSSTGLACSTRDRDMMIEDCQPKGLLTGPWLPHYSGGCDQGYQRDVRWGPGPAGRTLIDLKSIRHEEVAAHFNVWLLAGYPPAPLRQGETVLIAKEAGAESPKKYCSITISEYS